MLTKNQIITTEIIDISNDGNGIAKYNSIVIFVPMTALGDICDIRILKVLPNYCFGKIEKLVTPSKDRITPICANFSQCGGCDFLHINYSAEKLAKENFVRSAFERIGKIDTTILETLSCDKEYRYRNKAQFPVREDSDGNANIGFFAQRSHRLIPCTDCFLQPELLNSVSASLVKLFNKYNIKAYNEELHTGSIKHIYLRYAEDTNQLMVCIVSTSKKINNLQSVISDIISQYPNIKTIILNINSNSTNVILGDENILLYGDGKITDKLSNLHIELSSQSFYQVNREGAQRLYSLAKDMLNLSKNDTLLDLYCGAGTIGLSMADSVKSVIGVEIVAQAIENAKQNAKNNSISNIEFICADAKDAASKLLSEGYSPTAIVLDPARKGCDTETLNAIIKMAPEKIAMISCNPATCARDCKVLAESGYIIQTIQPFDMFPRTKHIECVVLMSRVKK